jgi:hypothetical protein
MTDVEFNPEAIDGDNDGMIQDGTRFERPIEDAELNPAQDNSDAPEEPAVAAEVTETTTEPVEATLEAEEEVPALVPVANGVIGAGSAKKSKPKKKAAPAAAPEGEKVAVLSSRNMVWQGVGKLLKGYNFVSKDDAEKWLTLEAVKLATPEEIKSNLG